MYARANVVALFKTRPTDTNGTPIPPSEFATTKEARLRAVTSVLHGCHPP